MFDDFLGNFGKQKFGNNFDTGKLFEAITFIWENRERLMELVEQLPDLMREAGDNMQAAGSSATSAAAFLTGEKAGRRSVRDMADVAATALESSKDELQAAAELLEHFGEELEAIRIPFFKPQFMDVMGMELVSGLNMGEQQLFDNPGGRLKSSAERLKQISTSLTEVSSQMREMGDVLTDMGYAMKNVGEQLQNGGQTLHRFTALDEDDKS